MDTALDNAALAGFVFCLLWAAASDVRGLIVPDRAVMGILVLFPVHLLAHMLNTGSIAPALTDGATAFAYSIIVLIVGFGLFKANLIGVGDVKLAAGVTLWAGASNVLPFLLIAALASGVLGGAILLWRAALSNGQAEDVSFRTRLRRELAHPLPLGIAVAGSGLLIAAKLANA
jgi:Flp pilus assembly protein protease CpaA